MSDTIYQESVQRSPDICSNCLAVRQDRLERRATKTSHRGQTGGIADYVYPRETQTSKENGAAIECRNPPRFCHCGVKSAFYKRRDEQDEAENVLSTERAIEFATNLSETLTHLGYEHDRETLLDIVRERKTQEWWAPRDDKIFALATYEAVVNPTPHTTQRASAD